MYYVITKASTLDLLSSQHVITADAIDVSCHHQKKLLVLLMHFVSPLKLALLIYCVVIENCVCY